MRVNGSLRAGLLGLALLVGCGDAGASPRDASADLAPVDLMPLDASADLGADAAPRDASTATDAAQDGAAPDGMTGGTPPARVLFVGNSYTFYNDLPALYARTGAREPAPRVDDVTAGGRRLVQHAADAVLADRLTEAWDAVVLQEQSQIPGFPAGNPDRDASLRAAVDLADAVGDARVVLYLTWGRQRGDDRNPELFPDFEAMQARLDAGYAAMRDAIAAAGGDVTIAPVGPAFREVRARDEALFDRLYASDGSHPSPLGSQLAALVFARALDGTDLTSLRRPEGVAEADWALLVAAAEAAGAP